MSFKLPKIKGTQIGLKNPESVDEIKKDMLEGRFEFHERHARVGGVRDLAGTYYVVDGHHRFVAAFELLEETGQVRFVQELLYWGKWDELQYPHLERRPL